jgi:hypothetical protein
MNVGKLYQVVANKNSPEGILVSKSPDVLFTGVLDILKPDEIFIPLEENKTFKRTKVEIVKVCTPRGITGYAAFFEGSVEYKPVNQ